MSRKVAREIAFKTIFEKMFHIKTIDNTKLDTSMEICNSDIEKMISLEEDVVDINKDDSKFICELINGVYEKVDELDSIIRKHLKNWAMERISKIDIAILRLSIYEILYRDDIPDKVSVNEAVEIAKTYSEDTSPSFINGVLAEIIKGK